MTPISRRKLLASSAAATAAFGSAAHAAGEPFSVKNGRIRQSIMGWCFKPMPTLELAKHCKDIIGHYHTAGCPGRAELDDTQEINYPPILRAILETGYKGYVAQEFIPTWDDPIAALRHAAGLCDV